MIPIPGADTGPELSRVSPLIGLDFQQKLAKVHSPKT